MRPFMFVQSVYNFNLKLENYPAKYNNGHELKISVHIYSTGF